MALPMRQVLAPLRSPVVFILGATGTGKSKLAIEIGKEFNGEIISADSMQIYKGLDIVTNKVTDEEQKECHHHMLDFVSPLEGNYSIHDFKKQAVLLIDDILQRKKLPIVVGGTNYYIEALIWNTLIKREDIAEASNVFGKGDTNVSSEELNDSKDHSNSSLPSVTKGNHHYRNKPDITEEAEFPYQQRNERDEMYKTMDTPDLYKKLRQVDPEMANRIHPKDRRKILRGLQVFDLFGVPMSKVYQSQKTSKSLPIGKLRYQDLCVMQVQCNLEVLDRRVNKRVDTMIERGLIQELLEFHDEYNAQRIKDNKEVDYETGIFQSIGFKEFHEYLILSPEERKTEAGQRLFQEGVENMKIATRQYARRQRRWINNRFLTKSDCKTELPDIYAVDSSDVSQWKDKVFDPAAKIVEDLLQGKTPEQKPEPIAENTNRHVFNRCEACNKDFLMEHQWREHLNSHSHKKRTYNMRKRQKQLAETTKIMDSYIQLKSTELSSDDSDTTDLNELWKEEAEVQ